MKPQPSPIRQYTSTHNWWGGLLLAAAFFALLHLASDGPSDHETATALESWARDIAEAEQADKRRLLNAQAACTSRHGQHALVLMTTDGDLVCRHALLHTAGKQV